MGAMRFLVARRDQLSDTAVERAYLSGLDEIPWRCRSQWTTYGFIVERDESESGNLFIRVRVEGHGELVLSTGSLVEREDPYHLEVELARGTINRLRNQLAAWEGAGLVVPEAVRQGISAASRQFSQAATRQAEVDVAADLATRATELALGAMTLLGSAYAQQALTGRRAAGGKLPTLWGFRLGAGCPDPVQTPLLAEAFNTATVPLVWRDIEVSEGRREWSAMDRQIDWCRASGLRIASGPLLQVDRWSLPDWMYLFGQDDMESFHTCVAEHIHEVVNRYRGKVQLWQCAARLNMQNDFGHNEEQRLRLAVLTIEAIRRLDARAPILLSVDQPWSEFMSREDYDLSPLHFVDALVRSEIGLSGIGVEINFGYEPPGTAPRDPLELSRQLDRYSTLGLPLLVSLVAPSSLDADSLTRSSAAPIQYVAGPSVSPSAQSTWAESYLPIMLAKPSVQGLVWNQFSDQQPHEFAHGGLFDAAGAAKPLVQEFRQLRAQFVV
jgi:hypothetical protein